MKKFIKIALAGNPNCGKTTVFNMLTGTRQHTGNYPGVTVEKKTGNCSYKDYQIEITDLPGTYCLSAFSQEEIVARDFILSQHPDLVIDIVDASNLERNLYLAVQLIEMQVPLLIVFNMADIAEKRGILFDIDKLQSLLGVQIVQTVASKEKGKEALLAKIAEMYENKPTNNVKIKYGNEVEDHLEKIIDALDDQIPVVAKYGKRWVATKLLEQDCQITEQISDSRIYDITAKCIKHINEIFGDDPIVIIPDKRYGFISGACQECVQNTIEHRHDISDKIDSVLTHKIMGMPIFLLMMYAVFQLVFIIGAEPVHLMESLFGWLGSLITNHWFTGQDSLLLSLIVDGIIGGVGGVLAFLPNILILFLAVAFLEDSGYMARAAFIMDRLMHKIGLHGKSFIPLLIGFGCSVPAIMATRILENKRNRLTTIMIIPLISCGARFPIYALFIPAFFAAKWQGPILWIIYIIGILLAIFGAKVLRKTAFRGETVSYVMELPPYRMPTIKGLLIHTWDRGSEYLKKAGTVILGFSILMWAASTFPKVSTESFTDMTAEQIQVAQLKNSYVGKIGIAAEPILRPIGFDWKIGTALVAAFGAKELFVSQLSIIYSLGEDADSRSAFQQKLRTDYTGLQGFCVILFCLIAMPCMATAVITYKETRSIWVALSQWGGLTALGYILTLIVYQIGSVWI